MQVHTQHLVNRILKTLHKTAFSVTFLSSLSLFGECVQAASLQIEMTIEGKGRRKADESVWLLMGKDQTLSSADCEVFALDELGFNVDCLAVDDVHNPYLNPYLKVSEVHRFLSTTPLVTLKNPHIAEILYGYNSFLIGNKINASDVDIAGKTVHLFGRTSEKLFFTLMHLCMQTYIDIESKQQMMHMMVCDLLPMVRPIVRFIFEGVSYDCVKESGRINMPFVIKSMCDAYFATHKPARHSFNSHYLVDTQKYMQFFCKKYPTASTDIKFSAKHGMSIFKEHTNILIDMLNEIPGHIDFMIEEAEKYNEVRSSSKYRLQQKLKGKHKHPSECQPDLSEAEKTVAQPLSDAELISIFDEKPSSNKVLPKKKKNSPKKNKLKGKNVLESNAIMPDSPIRILKRDETLVDLSSPVCIEQMPKSDDDSFSDEGSVVQNSLILDIQENSMPNSLPMKAEFSEDYFNVLQVINPKTYVLLDAKFDLDTFIIDAALELQWVLSRETKASIVSEFDGAKKELEELGTKSRLFSYLLDQLARNIVKTMYEQRS